MITGSPKISQRTVTRKFLACYMILTITVVATYSGNLIAFLSITKLKSPINSLEDLAAKPEWQAGFQAGSSNHDLFRVFTLFLSIEWYSTRLGDTALRIVIKTAYLVTGPCAIISSQISSRFE